MGHQASPHSFVIRTRSGLSRLDVERAVEAPWKDLLFLSLGSHALSKAQFFLSPLRTKVGP